MDLIGRIVLYFIPVKFGAFEVNPQSDELRKDGIRIRLSGQPFQILLMLLERPGELVTRDRLRERLWHDGTLVDFEGGLNAAINKLRRALNDSADKPRYIETVPGRGYRFIGRLETIEPLPDRPAIVKDPRRRRWLWVPLSIAALTAAFLLGWRLHNSPDSAADWKLTQFTSDAGISETPALSPDGKFMAYSSDRGGGGQRDLYIKQTSGGQPIRLTFDGAGNTSPNFSPDGSRIVFRSERDRGGVYVIPSFGGEARLLANEGRHPRFSPDGSQVAYWIGAPGVAQLVPGSGAVWVVPVVGGEPRRIGPEFTGARFPLWSPDGKYLLVAAYTASTAYEKGAADWWLAPVGEGKPIRTGAYQALTRAGLDPSDLDVKEAAGYRLPQPGCWLTRGDRVVFSIASGDTVNIWQTIISPLGKITGGFQRLTTGAGNEVDPSCTSAGAVAFTNLEMRRDVWLRPFDLVRGKSNGALEHITDGPALHDHASLSADGRFVAFASNQSGHMNIWLRDVAAGSERQLADSPFTQRYPEISGSGDRVAFSSYEGKNWLLYAVEPGRSPANLCEGFRATDWSRDEKTLLVFGGNPYQIDLLDVASRQRIPLLEHASHQLVYGRFSPDNRWVSFTERVGPSRSWIAIAPVDRKKPVPESAWIRISEERPEDWINWSPDGKMLYFTSQRDGHRCLWAQRLDAGSHRPVGAPFAVEHLHGHQFYRVGGWPAAGGRIAMVLNESTGNIWMMSRPRR